MFKEGISLRSLATFAPLSDLTLEVLHRHLRVFTLKSGQMLFHRGDPACAFYIVLSGAVQLTESASNGREVHFQILGEGDIFGLLAITGKRPYPHSSYALGKTTIGAVCGEDAVDLITKYPDFAIFIITFLVDGLHKAHARIKHLSTETAEQRLARVLIMYAGKFGSVENDMVSIDLTLSQQCLANTLGVTLETVNRILRHWEQEKIIHCSRQHIDILDMDLLERTVADPSC